MNDHKKLEQALRKNKNRYKTVLDGLPLRIFLKDRDLVYISCNENYARDLNIKPEQIAGKTDYDFFPLALAEKYRKDDKRIRQSAKTEDIEERYIQQGRRIFVHTVKIPIKDEQGNVAGILGIFRDISEKKKTERKFKKIMERKTELISMVSHELKTPLSAIQDGIEMVLEGMAGAINSEQKDFLEIAKKNADRLSRLIVDILNLQKIESDKTEFNILEHNINQTVQEVYTEMSPLARLKGLNLLTKLDVNLPALRFDQDKIARVLTNIVDNAIKFSQRGKITIATSRDTGNAICVSVQDSGPGIKKEEIPRLFHQFVQLSNSKNRENPGAGIGLAISKKIIERHKGRIWVESEFGKGATFYFILPIRRKSGAGCRKES